jgi:2-amino-4-hydroxy-6-hydroxymethyldihydropteridine diphosphokinase
MAKLVECTIALGANLGDTRASMRFARAELTEIAAGDLRASSLWKTKPVDCPPGSPDFLNAVVSFNYDGSADDLLDVIQAIEGEAGRGAGVRERNAPRELDLDLLLFGNEQRATARLTLPHPRAQDRAFVLAPLAELHPRLIWPGGEVTVAALLTKLPEEERALCTIVPGRW